MSEASPSRSPSLRAARAAACALALACATLPAAAGAAPIFFSATAGFGFDPDGLDPVADVSAEDQLAVANALFADQLDLDLELEQSILQVISRPDLPAPGDPYVADVEFTITNTSGGVLADAVLAFTAVAPYADSQQLPPERVGLDSESIEIVRYVAGETELFLGALRLGPMASDQTLVRSVRYVVTTDMPRNETDGFILPPIGVTGFRNLSVPEPSAAALLALAALALAARRRSMLLVLLAATVALPAAADDEGPVQALRARALAHAGACADAAGVLERPGVPQDPESWLRVGECHVAAGAGAPALAALARAIELDPARAHAHLLAGIARYHLGDLAGAADSLARARAGGARDARLELYTGLLELEAGDALGAADSFARARRLDRAAVEPMASYYEGVARERDRNYDAARGALARVLEGSPESPWSEQAERVLTRISTRGPGRSWLEVTAGIEYDDNAVLRGAGVRLPREISHQSDPRLVWALESGWELLRGPTWNAGALVYYYGSSHDDLDDFNLQAPSLAFWHDYDFSETASLRTRYDFAYAWAGGDSFVSSHTLASTLHQDWGGAGRSRLGARLYQYDYRYPIPDVENAVAGTCAALVCGPPGVNEKKDRDRDGNGVGVSLDHALPLGVADAELRAGYGFRRYFARGDDYSYQSHELRLGAGARLPLELGLELDAAYAYEPYRRRSTYPDPDTLVARTPYALDGASRRDRVLRLDAALQRRVGRATVTARYSALSSDSNTEVFDYNQRIFGLYVTLRMER